MNITGETTALEATDVSLQLTVATTADETTSLYVFLGGTAINQLNDLLKNMGEITTIDPCSSQRVCTSSHVFSTVQTQCRSSPQLCSRTQILA